MQLSANLSMLYADLPLAERLEAAARDGFAGVEIQFPYDVVPTSLAQMLRAHAMPLVLINTPAGSPGEVGLAGLPGREAEFRQAMKTALAVCAATGCPSVHVMAGRPPADADPAAVRATLIANLAWAAPLARAQGVTLTLEPLNRHDVPGYAYHQPAEALAVLRTLDDPTVRLQFDFYHVQREGLDLPGELATALPWVHHVQLARAEGRHEPDLADTAVIAGLRALRTSGYAGWIGAEYKPQGDTTAGLTAWLPAYHRLLAPSRGSA
ncbi:TIM barrel protein [Achromobacter sp. GG226]|nr:TIM barrel protein [Verticiella sp. GG226]